MFLFKTVVCLATQFGHLGDGYGGRTPTVLTRRPVQASDVGIAHRTWPIGSIVKVTNLRTGDSAIAQVIDRGPYGKVDHNGKWFNSRKERMRKGTYRGCADLTPKLVRLINHNKREPIQLSLLWASVKE